MSYVVEVIPRAMRRLRELPDDLQGRVLRTLENLAIEPRPPAARPLSQAPGKYSLWLGEVRLLYRVHDGLALVELQRIQYHP